MRWALRFAVSTSILSIILLLLLKNHLEDLWDQYSVGTYIATSWDNTLQHDTVENIPTFRGQPGDQVIIMAKLEKENTDWVSEQLPEYAIAPISQTPLANPPPTSWQAAIYTVNPTSANSTLLTTPMNKGHEGMAYLSYIIDNYDHLPSLMAFLHSHRAGFLSAWHTDTPLHNNVDALHSLQKPFVQKNGYVNLRCNWNPGCKEAHRVNAHVTPEVWAEIFSGTETEKGGAPMQVGAACCAQFAVSRDQVRRRPVGDYVRFRDWIVRTEKSDAESGRVLEFLWHVVFGMEAV
ncbi:hypothetical protein P7C71_g4349, partial [Lecanoromycetidae sp. Uapishka_2]